MAGIRRVGVLGATGIGVGSMLGAGVFSGMWALLFAAGPWYLAALALAAIIAIANALSTAQLAARHPVAGGAYTYGRRELGASSGLIAGAAFVLGKTASVAVAAAVLGAYVLPGHPQLVATGAIALSWAFNARGITRTAWGASVLAVIVSIALVTLIAGALLSDTATTNPLLAAQSPAPGSWAAVLVGASAVFFAFAGYARIATLGEEVRSPERTIPRAIMLALGWVLALYLGLAVALRGTSATQSDLAHAPLEVLARAAGLPVPLVTIAAVLAVAGAMLGVMAGAGRTAMAMARERDLPRGLARQGKSGAPWRAELVIAVGAIALVWTPDVSLILVSAAAVLAYYAVANVAALAQLRAGQVGPMRVPAVVPAVGLVGSVVLGMAALWNASRGYVPAAVMVAVVLGWPLTVRIIRRARARR